jgi:hypothetical protein
LKSTVLCVCDSRLVLQWMQKALQEVHPVLTATSLSQAIAVASVEPLDLVLIAASEENTASYASTIKFVQPTCAILALTADLQTGQNLPVGVDALIHVECIGSPVPLRQMLQEVMEEADWAIN